MIKYILLCSLLSACAQSPYQNQQIISASGALLQAGQTSRTPVSNVQALGTGINGYNGVAINPSPYALSNEASQIHCSTTRMGIWLNTNCY